jgi:hypothetical protein
LEDLRERRQAAALQLLDRALTLSHGRSGLPTAEAEDQAKNDGGALLLRQGRERRAEGNPLHDLARAIGHSGVRRVIDRDRRACLATTIDDRVARDAEEPAPDCAALPWN